VRPPVVHAERTLRPTCAPLERLLAGPTGGRTIGGCQCGSAGPRLAALCADRGVAFRGAPCGAPGAARRGAPDGARGAASRAARGAADGPPTAHRRNGRVAVPEPDLGWASGGVTTRSVERRPLESVAVGEVATRRPGRRDAQGQPSLWYRPAASGRRALPAARRAATAARPAATRPCGPRPVGAVPTRAGPPAGRLRSVARSADSLPGGRGITRRRGRATRQAASRPVRGASGAPDRHRTGACAKSPPEPARASSARYRRLARKFPPGAGAGCGEAGRRRAGHGCTSLTVPAPMASRTEYPAGVRRFLPAQGLACGGTECPWEGQFLESRDALGTAAPRLRIPAQVLRSANRGSASQVPCRPSHTPPYRYHAANLPLGKRISTPHFSLHEPRLYTPSLPFQGLPNEPLSSPPRIAFQGGARGAIPRAKDHVSCTVAKHDRRRRGPRFVPPPRGEPPRYTSCLAIDE